jgi:hypothetical protein
MRSRLGVRASPLGRLLAWIGQSRRRADAVALVLLFVIFRTMYVFSASWPLPNMALTYAAIGLTLMVLQVVLYKLARHPIVLREMVLWVIGISVFSWAISGGLKLK